MSNFVLNKVKQKKENKEKLTNSKEIVKLINEFIMDGRVGKENIELSYTSEGYVVIRFVTMFGRMIGEYETKYRCDEVDMKYIEE